MTRVRSWLAVAVVVATTFNGVALAFAPLPTAAPTSTGTRLGAAASSIVTGPSGQAASSFEQDLMLTLQIIRDHQARSTTVSMEQFIQQEQAVAALPVVPPLTVDVAVPYNAAAQLAYKAASSSGMSFADFQVQYVAEAVAMVTSKKQQREAAGTTKATPASTPTTVDLSIPYDAAARLAYAAAGSAGSFDDFQRQYQLDAVASVKAKRTPTAATTTSATTVVDVSIPYDAAARLAYAAAGSTGSFDDFQRQYELDAVASVVAKRQPMAAAVVDPNDVSIPYDAAARLAYAAWGNTGGAPSYEEFKVQFEAQAVADVTAKQQQRRA